MDAVSALLRAAVRLADASAAIVAFDDDQAPVAFAGCSHGAAAAALRDGRGAYIDCRVAGSPMTLILLEPGRSMADDAALGALALELGHAVLEARTIFEGDLAALAGSIETLADPVVVFDPPLAGEEVARFVCVNGAFQRLFGYATRDVVGRTEDLLFSPATNMDNVMHVRDRLAVGEPVRSILELQTREGVPVWIELTARVVLGGDDERPKYYVSTLRDVTARKEFEAAVAAEKQRLSVTLKAIGDAVITALPDGRIDFINAAAQRLLNVAFADVYGMPLRAIVDLRDTKDAPCEIALDPAGDVRGEGLLYGPERNVQIAFVSSPMWGLARQPFGYVIVLRDVTAQTRLTRRLAYEASHDLLTRLPNRRRFEEMIANALESARNSGSVHMVAYIDLDRFKIVNDRFGHQVGDRLLRDIAHNMALNVRGNDILARLGGDEFALLLHECAPASAECVAEKIRTSVEDVPIELDGEPFHIGASVGLATLDRHSESALAVLALADEACYRAKASGRNAVVGAEANATRSS